MKRVRGKNTGHCKIDGCSQGYYSLGYCRMHYERSRIGSDNLTNPSGLRKDFHQKGMSDEEKFFARITKDKSGCWLWLGPFYTSGRNKEFEYGRLPIKQNDGKWKSILAHVFSYSHFKGTVPDGHEIHHKCNNQICVNPDHLEAVTKTEHMNKSSWVTSLNVMKDRCPKGHDKSEYVRDSTTGYRRCLQCARERREYYHQHYLNVVRPKALNSPKYKPRNKIKKEDIPSIINAYNRREATQRKLASIYGVTPSAVSYIIKKEKENTNACIASI